MISLASLLKFCHTITMSHEKLRKYAVKAISRILPLDSETCSEMVNYTLTLPNSEIESHLLDLLGHSEESYEVISKFMELKKDEGNEESQKPRKESSKSKDLPQWGPNSNVLPPKTRARLQNNNTSVTVSELSSIKPSNKLSTAQAKKSKRKNLDNLKDIDAVLNELEVTKAQESVCLDGSSRVVRVCNCMATKHPLFEVAPNCLNCGKIICSKEGLQPCSFCGKELLSAREKMEIVKILQLEKDLLKTKQANPSDKLVQQQTTESQKYIKFSNSTGENLWKAQEEAFKMVEQEAKRRRELEEVTALKKKELEDQVRELEHYKRTKNVDEALLNAQNRLETLLHYQETGAERSKIIDNAADFEMPSLSSGSMWLSPMERALQLKKQHKKLRAFENEEKSRVGRSNKVVEMVIKDGKMKMVEKTVNVSEESQKDIEELEKELRREKLVNEQDLTKNIWDYESDQNKWEKPVYVSKNPAVSSQNHFSDRPSRVQYDQLDNVELVASLPS